MNRTKEYAGLCAGISLVGLFALLNALEAMLVVGAGLGAIASWWLRCPVRWVADCGSEMIAGLTEIII